jgi:hypothetical protein
MRHDRIEGISIHTRVVCVSAFYDIAVPDACCCRSQKEDCRGALVGVLLQSFTVVVSQGREGEWKQLLSLYCSGLSVFGRPSLHPKLGGIPNVSDQLVLVFGCRHMQGIQILNIRRKHRRHSGLMIDRNPPGCEQT